MADSLLSSIPETVFKGASAGHDQREDYAALNDAAGSIAGVLNTLRQRKQQQEQMRLEAVQKLMTGTGAAGGVMTPEALAAAQNYGLGGGAMPKFTPESFGAKKPTKVLQASTLKALESVDPHMAAGLAPFVNQPIDDVLHTAIQGKISLIKEEGRATIEKNKLDALKDWRKQKMDFATKNPLSVTDRMALEVVRQFGDVPDTMRSDEQNKALQWAYQYSTGASLEDTPVPQGVIKSFMQFIGGGKEPPETNKGVKFPNVNQPKPLGGGVSKKTISGITVGAVIETKKGKMRVTAVDANGVPTEGDFIK